MEKVVIFQKINQTNKLSINQNFKFVYTLVYSNCYPYVSRYNKNFQLCIFQVAVDIYYIETLLYLYTIAKRYIINEIQSNFQR